jgi:hypothetical protein
MTTTRRSRMFASGDATTPSLTIPAAVITDAQVPFRAADTVQVSIGDGSRRVTTAETAEGPTPR